MPCSHPGCQARTQNEFCHSHIPLDQRPQCPICHEAIIRNRHTTECNHIFHEACISRWLDANDTCPVCRTVIQEEEESEWAPESEGSLEQMFRAIREAGATGGSVTVNFSFPPGASGR